MTPNRLNENKALYVRQMATPVPVSQSAAEHMWASVPEDQRVSRPKETVQSTRRSELRLRERKGLRP